MSEKTIKATDDNIHKVVKDEIERLGNEADLNHIDVSSVTNMVELFEHTDFKGNIEQWNFDKVENMYSIFNECPLMRKYGSDGEFLKDGWLKNQNAHTAARALSELSYQDVATKLIEAKLEPEMVAGILNKFFDPDWALKVLVHLNTIDKTQADSAFAILVDQESDVLNKDKRLKEEDHHNISQAALYPHTFAKEMLDRPDEMFSFKKALLFIRAERSDQIEGIYQKLQSNPEDEEILAELDRENKQQMRVIDLYRRKSKTKTLIEERKGEGEDTKDLEELVLVYGWAALRDVSIDDDEVLRSEFRKYYEKQVPDMEHPSPEEAVKMIHDGNQNLLRYLAFRWHRANNVEIDDIEENGYLFKYMSFVGV